MAQAARVRKRKPPRSVRVPAKRRVSKEDFALKMRRNPTPAEKCLRDALKAADHKFSSQQILNGYIVDFYFPAAKLIVEVDGYYHFTPTGKTVDKIRTGVLIRNGYRVLRFPNNEVITHTELVLRRIDKALNVREAPGRRPV